MTAQGTASADHGALMDGVYRHQRHFYDLTRKYYLFGRDSLIAGLAMERGQSVLEVACGTGRNLLMIGRRWPGAKLFGLDISNEMLRSARATLGHAAVLTQADATAFDARQSFGQENFDRVVLSYSLSMIPDWTAALERAASHVAPGGSLHIVDFGDCAGLPSLLRRGLTAWLARFHVTARAQLANAASLVAMREGLSMTSKRGCLGYYRIIVLTRPAA